MNKLLGICAFLMVSGCKCKKDDPVTPAAPYMITTSGSTWNYTTQSYAPVPSTGSYTLKATAKDTVYNGRTYRVFTNSNTGSDYYNQTGTDYYQFGNFAALNQAVDLLYLKDVTAGTSWVETKTVTLPGIPIPVAVPINLKIMETGLSYTVGAKTFTDVVHVQMSLGALSVGGFPVAPVSDINFYYARGIGRIYSRSKIIIIVAIAGVNINTDDEVKLASYTIL